VREGGESGLKSDFGVKREGFSEEVGLGCRSGLVNWKVGWRSWVLRTRDEQR